MDISFFEKRSKNVRGTEINNFVFILESADDDESGEDWTLDLKEEEEYEDEEIANVRCLENGGEEITLLGDDRNGHFEIG